MPVQFYQEMDNFLESFKKEVLQEHSRFNKKGPSLGLKKRRILQQRTQVARRNNGNSNGGNKDNSNSRNNSNSNPNVLPVVEDMPEALTATQGNVEESMENFINEQQH